MKCSNTKCKTKGRNKQVFDCSVLNEMIGRDVCKDGNNLCKNCIKIYYKKTYDEIAEMDMMKA